MNIDAFDFNLPDELIAQEPPPQRGASRLLVLSRSTGGLRDESFAQIPDFLLPGDLLVLNNTRVFPARLLGRRITSGGAVECLLVRETSPQVWEALMHPGQKLRPGSRVVFEHEGVALYGEVLERHFFGRRSLRLWTEDGSRIADVIDRLGHIPLPPYIKRADRPSDRERYQTIYARERGSIAAPTAGLHFTDDVMQRLTARGVMHVEITLHVGYGTFKPVRAENIDEHTVDAEAFTVSAEAAAAVTAALRDRRRVIAVGTTTTRALESLQIDEGVVRPSTGQTELFIKPGHDFRVVQGLLTNFHLPRSSLLLLVSAFAGRERVLSAYRHAVDERYRFYSYGDAMLIV